MNPTAGIPGDVLIARRARSVCLVCGLTPMVAPSASDEVPRVCEDCRAKLPKVPRFNARKHREEGLAHLARLLDAPPTPGSEVKRSPLCVRLVHCGHLAELSPPVVNGETEERDIRCLTCGRCGHESRRVGIR